MRSSGSHCAEMRARPGCPAGYNAHAACKRAARRRHAPSTLYSSSWSWRSWTASSTRAGSPSSKSTQSRSACKRMRPPAGRAGSRKSGVGARRRATPESQQHHRTRTHPSPRRVDSALPRRPRRPGISPPVTTLSALCRRFPRPHILRVLSVNGFAFPVSRTASTSDSPLLSTQPTCYRATASRPGRAARVDVHRRMHPREPMSGHILPVIISWHLGIELVRFAGSTTGQLDAAKFWNAWERGAEVTTDVFSGKLGLLGGRPPADRRPARCLSSAPA